METKAVTNKRIYKFGEFDFMKALAVLGLPIVHLLEEGIYGKKIGFQIRMRTYQKNSSTHNNIEDFLFLLHK